MENGNQPEKNPPEVEALLKELEMQRLLSAANRNSGGRGRSRLISVCILLILLLLLAWGLYHAAEVMKAAPRPHTELLPAETVNP